MSASGPKLTSATHSGCPLSGAKPTSDAKAIEEWGALLAHLLASPDAETMIDPMHRLAWQIIDHARAVRLREEAKEKRD
jgi:hypothetical protein